VVELSEFREVPGVLLMALFGHGPMSTSVRFRPKRRLDFGSQSAFDPTTDFVQLSSA
jgi:hypothetical protein